MPQDNQSLDLHSFLQENTVKRLFDLLLETAKEMPELQNKLPHDCSFLFDFETILLKKNSEEDKERLIQKNQLSKSLQERTLSLMTKLVYTCLEEPNTPLPTDCKLLFVACFNPSHWVAITAELAKLNQEAVRVDVEALQEAYRANKQELAAKAEAEKKELLLNHVRNALIKKYNLHENPKNLLALFETVDLHFYDSRDPNTPNGIVYYDSARLQLDPQFNLHNSPCSSQRGNTCGDHSVFNVFFMGLLKQALFINEQGSISSADLRTISEQLHMLSTLELNLHVDLALSEVDENDPEEAKAQALVKRLDLENEIDQIKKAIQDIKPALKNLLGQIHQYNVLLGLDSPAPQLSRPETGVEDKTETEAEEKTETEAEDKTKTEAEEKTETEAEDKNEEKINNETDLSLPTQAQIQKMEALLHDLQGFNEQEIRDQLISILEEMTISENPFYDMGLVQAHFNLDQANFHHALIVDTLIRAKMDKIVAQTSQQVTEELLPKINKQIDIITAQMANSETLLQALAKEIHNWKTSGKASLCIQDIRAVLNPHNLSAEQTETIIKAAEELTTIASAILARDEKNDYLNEKQYFCILEQIEQTLQTEITCSQKIRNIQAVLSELDLSSALPYPSLKESIDLLADMIEELHYHGNSYNKEKIEKALNIDLNLSTSQILAQQLMDRKAGGLILKACQPVLENTFFLINSALQRIKKQVPDKTLRKRIIETLKLSLAENDLSASTQQDVLNLLQPLNLSKENEEAVMNAVKEIYNLATTTARDPDQQNDYLNAVKAPVILKEIEEFLDKKVKKKSNLLYSLLSWLTKPASAVEAAPRQQAERQAHKAPTAF